MFLVVDNTSGADLGVHQTRNTLAEAHVTAITLGLEPDWAIDRIVNCSEQLSLLLTPPTSPNLEVVFYIDRDERGLNLSIMQDDVLHARGSYGDVATLMSAVRFIQLRNAAA